MLRKIVTVTIFIFTGCKEQIVHNLEEVDANRIVTTLHQAGMNSEKKVQADGRWSIAVESSAAMAALKLLDDRRVVKVTNRPSGIKGSVISSREAQKFEYERGLSQEIEQTLLSLPGFLEARVHLNLPTPDPLLGKVSGNESGTGSVLILSNGTPTLAQADVAKLVAGASGIAPDRISVLISITESEQVSAPLLSSDAVITEQGWIANNSGVIGIATFVTLFGVCIASLIGRRRFGKLQSEFESVRSRV